MYTREGAVYASSRDVAAFFGKRHDNVVRDIQALIADAPPCASNFGETSETVVMPRGGTRQSRTYEMTRDDFTLLTMGTWRTVIYGGELDAILGNAWIMLTGGSGGLPIFVYPVSWGEKMQDAA